MTATPTLPTGLHWVDAVCPRCGQHELVAVDLRAVLQVPEGDLPSVRIRARSKPVDHACHQVSLVVDQDTGELTMRLAGDDQ
jgi:hypothetical protein